MTLPLFIYRRENKAFLAYKLRNLVSINLFKAPAQIPSGVWTDVAFIYAGFGLAVFETTPNDPIGALRRRLEACF